MDIEVKTSHHFQQAIDPNRVKLLILQFIKDQIGGSRGNLVTFRPAKVAQDVSVYSRKSPRAETVIIRNFLEELVERGFIQIVKRSARGKVYGIQRNSKLWQLLEDNEPVKVLELLELERSK